MLLKHYREPDDSVLSYCEQHHPQLVEEITDIMDRFQEAGEPEVDRYKFFNKELDEASPGLKKMFLAEAMAATGSASRIMHRGAIPAQSLQVLGVERDHGLNGPDRTKEHDIGL